MAAKLTRLAHKIAIQLHLVAMNCTTFNSRSRLPIRKFLDTLSYNFTFTEELRTISSVNLQRQVAQCCFGTDS
jgi:hypothetical protein